MAKLQAAAAGWNAGQNYYAKTMRVEDVLIDPLIAKVFTLKTEMIEEVRRSMNEKGYDKSQPITVWKGTNIVVDGHTRLAAAKVAGLDEIPVAEMEFADADEAILYTFERQVLRRNLTQAEILSAVQMMPEHKAKNGTGRTAQQLADKLGVSAAHLYQARKVLKEAAPEDIEAVKAEEKTVSEVYNTLRKPKPKPASEPVPEAPQLVPAPALEAPQLELDELDTPQTVPEAPQLVPEPASEAPQLELDDELDVIMQAAEVLANALRLLESDDRTNLDFWAILSLLKDVQGYLDELVYRYTN